MPALNETAEDPHALGKDHAFNDRFIPLLEGSHLFSDFSRQDLEVFARYAKICLVPKGKVLFKEGENSGMMYYVVEGKLDVFKEDTSYQRKKLTTIHPGKTLGEMSLLDGLPYSASSNATVESTLLMMSRSDFHAFAKHHPSQSLKLTLKLARLMSLRLRRTTGILADYLD